MHFIAIDCGASFIKAALLEEDGKTLDSCHYATNMYDKKRTVIDNLMCSIESILSRFIRKVNNYGTFFIAISNEMHGFILTDNRANPVIDYMSWQDESAKLPYNENYTYLDLYTQKVSSGDIEHSGMPIKAGLPSINLFYLFQSGKIKRDTPLNFYTLGDYIIRKISNKEPGIHPTNAAATGLFNLCTNNWNELMLQKLNFQNIKFPDINIDNAVCCAYLNHTIFLYPAIGDQQAALYGVDFTTKEISFNFGTGAQVSVLGDLNFSPRYQIRPFMDGKYIKTIPHIPSGRAINVFYRFVKEIAQATDSSVDDDFVWNIIQSRLDNNDDLKVDLSFFSNAISDYDRGSITGISETNFTIGSLFGSVYNQVAENAVEAANILVENSNQINRLVFTGGIMRRNPQIVNAIAKAFDFSSIETIADETIKGLYRYIVNGKKYNDLILARQCDIK